MLTNESNSSSVEYCFSPTPLEGPLLDYAKFALAMDGYATVVVVVLGLICNSLCAMVFLQSKKKSLIYCYLLPLAIWDSILLISSFFMYSFPQMMYGLFWDVNSGNYAYSVPVWYAIGNMSLVGPLWVVLALTVDRFSALCHPFWHLRHMVDRRAVQRRLILISILAVFYGLPRFFEVTVVMCRINSESLETTNVSEFYHTRNETEANFKPFLKKAPLAGDIFYQYTYKIVGGLLFYSLVPFCILFTLTVRIMIELRKAFKNRWKLSNGALPTKPPVVVKIETPSVPSRRLTNASLASSVSLGALSESPGTTNNGWIKRSSPAKRKFARPNLATNRKKTDCSATNGAAAPLIPKSRRSMSDDRTNSMLLAVIMKYLLSHVTPTAVDLLYIFGSDYINQSEFVSYLINVSNFLVTLNSACNFWIYFSGSLSFRGSIYHILGWKKELPQDVNTKKTGLVSKTSNCKDFIDDCTQKSGFGSALNSKTPTPKFHAGYRDLTNVNLEIFAARDRSNSCVVTFV